VELRREGLGKEISATPDCLSGIQHGRDLAFTQLFFLPDVAAVFPMRVGEQPANLLKRHRVAIMRGKAHDMHPCPARHHHHTYRTTEKLPSIVGGACEKPKILLCNQLLLNPAVRQLPIYLLQRMRGFVGSPSE
jgi:hypothetical protein